VGREILAQTVWYIVVPNILMFIYMRYINMVVDKLDKLYNALADVFETEEEIDGLDYLLIEDAMGHISKVKYEIEQGQPVLP